MTTSEPHLVRVLERIGETILNFHNSCRDEFHAEDLRRYVRQHCGVTAPGSADRVLRSLRAAGKLNYLIVSRRQSRYRWTPVNPLGRDSSQPMAVSLANAKAQSLF